MEDGLRLRTKSSSKLFCNVLILVFVEDGLRHYQGWAIIYPLNVLILVFVEDGLRHLPNPRHDCYYKSLNPCFCGRWSATDYQGYYGQT